MYDSVELFVQSLRYKPIIRLQATGNSDSYTIYT